ncbi:MAG: O-antigen ligase family protein [Blastocatellia bacterium]
MLELSFPLLPLLALIPNFFVIPDLTYQGLATQELVFASAATVFAILGLIKILGTGRAQPARLELDRESLWIFAALAAFIAWQLISLAWAPAFYDGVRVSGIWLGFGVFFMAGALRLRPRSAERLHAVLTVVCATLAVSIIYERWAYGDFLHGLFFSHGITAELLATLLPLQVLHYLCNEKRWVAVMSLAVSGLGVVALLIGLRRGAILGTLVALAAIGLALLFGTVRLQNRQRLVIVLALLLVATGVLGVMFRQTIAFRIEGATRLESAEGGLQTRLRGWITAWEMGKRSAIAGVGVAGYPNLYGSYRKYFVSGPQYQGIRDYAGGEDSDEIRTPLAHNEYLQVFVELGIVGLLLFALFWALVIRRLWRGRGNYRVLGALLGLTAFGVSSFTSAFSFRVTPSAFVVACLLGIGFAFLRNESDAEASPAVSMPKAVATACVAVLIIGCMMLSLRAYKVFASQRLQGRAHAQAPPLDFAFYAGNPAGNEKLLRRYHNVLALDSHNAGAHLGLGLLLYQLQKPAEAIPHLEYALKHGYSRPFGYVLLAFAHEQTGNLGGASQTLADCVASFPQSLFARSAYGEMLRKESKVDLLRRNQEEMYAINKPEAQSWEIALRMKIEEATAEATRRGVATPDKLLPRLESALVGVRAFHYLK